MIMMDVKTGLFVKNDFYTGISVLRAVLCYWVIIIHCVDIKINHIKYFTRHFHVPTFFLLSFYFYYPSVYNRNILKIKMRFQRLLYAYISWPFLIFVFNNILVMSSRFNTFFTYYTLKDLYIQFLIGARCYNHFWFHFNLMFISLFFTIISFTAKKKLLIIVEFIGIISLYFHFSGLNFYIFYNLKYPTNKTLGTLNELIPMAVFGCIFSSINLLLKLQNLNISFIFMFCFLLYLIFKYNIFFGPPGFLYPNILLNILASTILFVLFGSINIHKFQIINKLIKYITSFTGGIYYIHLIFPKYLYYIFNLDRSKTSYFFAFIIYIICFIICLFGYKLFKNSKFKYLFI